MRNPLLHFGNYRVQFIGDVHAGRTFNTKLERRGEYEAKQLAELERLLAVDADYHVQVGDLFDKFHVDESAVMAVYDTIKNSKVKRLFILGGNHDTAKNNVDVSSFELLEVMLKGLDHVFIVRTALNINLGAQTMTACGWAFNRKLLDNYLDKTDIVVCHLDSVSYGNDENVIPFAELAERGVSMVINGHEHLPTTKRVNGIEYIGTGSLLPYSHAEDGTGEHFITFDTAEDFITHTGELKNKFVRIYSDLPVEDFDCLQLQVLKGKKPVEADAVEHVEVEDWSLDQLGKLAGERTELSEDWVTKVLEEIKAAEAENA